MEGIIISNDAGDDDACTQLLHISQRSEDLAVNALLFHTEANELSRKKMRRAHHITLLARLAAGSVVASSAACGYTAYYQWSRLHRVWRLRNPLVVRKYYACSLATGCYTAAVLAFLMSPLNGIQSLYGGFLAQSARFDDMGIEALRLEQAFASIYGWSEAQRRRRLSSKDGWGVATTTGDIPRPTYADVMAMHDAAWTKIVLPLVPTDERGNDNNNNNNNSSDNVWEMSFSGVESSQELREALRRCEESWEQLVQEREEALQQ